MRLCGSMLGTAEAGNKDPENLSLGHMASISRVGWLVRLVRLVLGPL